MSGREPLRRPAGQSAPDSGERRAVEVQEGAAALLDQHPDLRVLLSEVGDKLREHFGPATELVIERFVDPESSAAPDELFVRVKTALSVEEARARLHRFEEEWWLDNMTRGGGLMNVALEFV